MCNWLIFSIVIGLIYFVISVKGVLEAEFLIIRNCIATYNLELFLLRGDVHSQPGPFCDITTAIPVRTSHHLAKKNHRPVIHTICNLITINTSSNCAGHHQFRFHGHSRLLNIAHFYEVRDLDHHSTFDILTSMALISYDCTVMGKLVAGCVHMSELTSRQRFLINLALSLHQAFTSFGHRFTISTLNVC